jgi:hypothetical protein
MLNSQLNRETIRQWAVAISTNGGPPKREAMSSLAVRMARGLRASVGTAQAPERFAAYEHQADGSVAKETRGAGTLSRSYAYDPAGAAHPPRRPGLLGDARQRVGGQASGPYADGRVTAEAT